MSKIDTRQHVIVEDDYHRAIKSIAGAKGVDMTEVVQGILTKDNFFKRKLAEVKRARS